MTRTPYPGPTVKQMAQELSYKQVLYDLKFWVKVSCVPQPPISELRQSGFIISTQMRVAGKV